MAYSKWKDIDQVERYAKKRYQALDQRLIDKREKKIVTRLFRNYGITGTIFDLPVGYGRFQPLLGEFGTVFAADLGFMPVMYQKKRIGVALDSINSDAEHIPLKDKSIDVVFCFRLFQHMHKKEERIAIFREFSRISRSWIVVSLYLSNALHNLHRSIVKQPSRITMLTEDDFEKEIREAEIQLIKKVSVLPGLHAHSICLFSPK